MSIVCIILCIGLCTMSFLKDKRIYSPTVTLFGLFAAISIAASMQLFDFYPIKDDVYIMLIIGVLCFAIGSLVGRRVRIGSSMLSNSSNYTYVNVRIYKIMMVITLALSVWYSYGAINLLLQGNSLTYIYQLHTNNGIGDTENLLAHSYLSNLLSVYILTPFSYLLIPLSVALYFKQKSFKYLALGIILMGFRIVYHGGRAIAFFTIGYIVLFTLASQKNKKINRPEGGNTIASLIKRLQKQKKMIYLVMFLCLILVVIMTMNRDIEFWESIYIYFAGCLGNWSQRLEQIYAYEHTNGLLSFRGFFYPISSALDIVGIRWPFFEYVDQIFTDFQYAVPVAPRINMNAFVTMFCFFYIDFDWFGIVFLSFIYGYVSRVLYANFERKTDVRSMTIYAIWYINVIVYSFNTAMLSYIQIVWALLFGVLVFTRDRRRGVI